jgi:hypothetical protein
MQVTAQIPAGGGSPEVVQIALQGERDFALAAVALRFAARMATDEMRLSEDRDQMFPSDAIDPIAAKAARAAIVVCHYAIAEIHTQWDPQRNAVGADPASLEVILEGEQAKQVYPQLLLGMGETARRSTLPLPGRQRRRMRALDSLMGQITNVTLPAEKP